MLNQLELDKLSKAILIEQGIKESVWKKQIIREAKETLFISENTGKGTPYSELTTLIINAEREKLVNKALEDMYGKENSKTKEVKEKNTDTATHNPENKHSY